MTAGAGDRKVRRVEAGNETSVQPDAIGPDTRPLMEFVLPMHGQVRARLWIPDPFTQQDADRIKKFLDALVIHHEVIGQHEDWMLRDVEPLDDHPVTKTYVDAQSLLGRADD